MNVAVFDLDLEGNRGMSVRCPLGARELSELMSSPHSTALERQLIERALDHEARTFGLRISPETIEGWRLQQITHGTERDRELQTAWEAGVEAARAKQAVVAKPARARQVAKCRSLLEIGNRLLPQDVRDEALDEWMDEIECAAAKDLPVFRRVLSILLRSLPALAWRNRQPAPARRGGAD